MVGGLDVQHAGLARLTLPDAAADGPTSSTAEAQPSAISAAASARSSLDWTVYWCGRSVISRRISRKSPEAACRPATMTSMRAGDLLDLFEDVRAEQHRAALVAHRAQQVHQVQALARVHAVERLVEQQHRRVVHEAPSPS